MPVMPRAFEERLHLPAAKGWKYYPHVPNKLVALELNHEFAVQTWTSILLAVYGVALLISSRE